MKRILIPSAIYTCLLILFPVPSIEAAKGAINVCADALVPSLFPFFVCSSMLITSGAAEKLSKFLTPLMKPLFGLGGACSLPIIMGYISGYPVGAKTAADLYISGDCSKKEAEKVLSFCNNSGPMFVIGALGSGMLKNTSVGVMLYISHIISSIVVGLIIRSVPACPVNRKKVLQAKKESLGEAFSNAVSSSCTLTLNICGFVIMFAILISFIDNIGIFKALSSLGIDYNLCKSLVYGFTECSGGCNAIANHFSSPLLCYMLLSSALSWSGLCVHMQVLGIIRKAKLSPALYFKGKVLSAIISPFITMLLYGFTTGRLYPLPFIQIIIIFATTVFAAFKIFNLLKHFYFKYCAHPPR